jgi:putative membrane protein
MNFLIRILISALAVMVTQWLLPGVHVESFMTGVIVAAVLSFLNAIVKPILVVLTIPVTVVTLGLFLIVINAFIIQLTANLVDGFVVNGFIWAVLFSFILSLVTSVFNSIDERDNQR